MDVRRLLVPALVVPALWAAAPAHAGDNSYVTVRAIDDRFEQVGLTCTGEDADPPDLRIGISKTHVLGHGSMSVTTADDALGGVLVKQPQPLRGVMYWVWTPLGGSPQAHWLVRVDDDVLTGDPLPLGGFWTRLDLVDATLHRDDGWTGTIEEYLAEHPTRTTWSAGLLTGGCLGSPEVRLDSIGTRKAGYDFEARSWVVVRYGDGRFTARAWRYDVRTHTSHPVEDARVTLLRRGPDDGHFRPVRTGRTDGHGRLSVRAEGPAYWRAVWHRAPQDVPSDVVQVR